MKRLEYSHCERFGDEVLGFKTSVVSERISGQNARYEKVMLS
jgi:hypothetical protein